MCLSGGRNMRDRRKENPSLAGLSRVPTLTKIIRLRWAVFGTATLVLYDPRFATGYNRGTLVFAVIHGNGPLPIWCKSI